MLVNVGTCHCACVHLLKIEIILMLDWNCFRTIIVAVFFLLMTVTGASTNKEISDINRFSSVDFVKALQKATIPPITPSMAKWNVSS
jgi:hypothetical protein